MNYSRLKIVLFTVVVLHSCNSQNRDFVCNENYEVIFEEYDYSNINQEWLEKDLKFYSNLIDVLENYPKEIEELIDIGYKDSIPLSKNFFVKKGIYGKGYTGVFYEFIYKDNDLVSYKLDLPLEDIKLLEKFGYKPQKYFVKTKDFYTKYDKYLFYYNFETVVKPNGIDFKENLSDKFNFYITPFSGITYGCRGGYGNGMLENRCAFKSLLYSQDLSSEDLIYLMHSINLASRMTAIEYYSRNTDLYIKEEQQKIEGVIDKIFKDFGKKRIEVLEFDVSFTSTVEEAINNQLKSECF